MTGSIVFFVLISLPNCRHEVKTNEKRIYKVQRKNMEQILYFTGTVKPLVEVPIIAPIDAVVDKIYHDYGEVVAQDQVIMMLNSQDLQKQYDENLTEYLKAKDSYMIAKAKFNGTEELWQSGLLAKNSYLNEQSTVAMAKITLIKATRNFKAVLAKMDGAVDNNITTLDIKDFTKVQTALTKKYNLLSLKAPATGILLTPPKNNEDKALTVGAAVKSGQAVALLGDLKGLRIVIEIPEVEINKVHPGMTAVVTGLAFGNHKLQGKLVSVNAQASSDNANTLPGFSALVIVDNLSRDEQKDIKVGMSAKVSLIVKQKEDLVAPLTAIWQEEGSAYVLLKNIDGSLQKHKVVTGEVHMDKVVILNGLKQDDLILEQAKFG